MISGTLFENGYTYQERADLATRTATFNAEAGTTYYILITGSGYDKQSRGLITLTVTGQPGQPLAPTNLQAIRINDNRVDLTWIDEAVDESSYTIQRSTSAEGPWSTVFTSGQPNTSFWSDMSAQGLLYYRVRAEGPGGVSNWAYASTDDNYPPTVSLIPDQIITKNTSSDAIPFTVADDRTAPESLSVTATSGNQTLIPNANLVIGGAGSNRTITITPASNQTGSVTITVTVNDGSLNSQRSFNVVISEPNDPTPTSIRILPASVLLNPGATQQFSATLLTQWGTPVDPQPESFTWDVIGSGGGTISSSGLLTAGSTPGDYQITASASTFTGTAYFTILGPNQPGAGAITDNFDDGDRTQGTAWFYQKPTAGLTVTDGGGLTKAISFNSNNNNASFFAKLPNSPVTLTETGNYIEVTFKYSRTGTTQNYKSGTRVGFFFQSGLPTADNYGTATSPAWLMTGLDSAGGYLVGFPSGTDSTSNIRKDSNAATNNSSTTTNNYLIHSANTTTGLIGTESSDTGLKLPPVGDAGLPATIRFRVEKTASGARITAGLTPNGGTETTIVRDDDSSPYLTFNALAFGSAAINQVNYYDNISVTTNVQTGPQYTVTFQTDGTPGATLTGQTTQTVPEGGNCTAVTAVAPTGYHFVKWKKRRHGL